MKICLCMFESRYQYIILDWSYAMLVMLWDVIEGHQSCKSNGSLQMKQDTTSIEKKTLQDPSRSFKILQDPSRSILD